MSYRIYIALICVAGLAGAAAAARQISAIDEITADHIGEFVTLYGTAAGYFLSREERAPHAFHVRDSAGQTIRVVAWPDIFENVKNKTMLQTSGTRVIITAQVAEHSGNLELQLQDWEELIVSAATSETLSIESEKLNSGTTAPDEFSTGSVTLPAVTGTTIEGPARI